MLYEVITNAPGCRGYRRPGEDHPGDEKGHVQAVGCEQ